MKVKNKTTEVVRCEFVPGGYVDPGAVVDVPETQADGSELIWDPHPYFEVVGAAGGPSLAELQDQARDAGLPVSGTKAELTERLAAEDTSGTAETQE